MKPPKLAVEVPKARCVFGAVKCTHIFNINEKGLYVCTQCGSVRQAQGYDGDWYMERDTNALGHDISDLAAHIVEQQKDGFLKEFEFLKTLTRQRAETENIVGVGQLGIYKMKNRYQNIISYEKTQVWLEPIEGEAGSEYINASYVGDGLGNNRYFVCCQAPLATTRGDFWRMIYQRRTKSIVMLTNTIENGKELCTQYWPDYTNVPMLYHGGVIVCMTGERHKGFYVERSFYLLHVKNVRASPLDPSNAVATPHRPIPIIFESDVPEHLMHHVTQYHIVEWLDCGVPPDPHGLLDIISKVDDPSGGEARVAVHCSSGAGRTGVFVLVSRILKQFKRFCEDRLCLPFDKMDVEEPPTPAPRAKDTAKFEEPAQFKFNILDTVLRMRFERPGMVQTRLQYYFCYHCICYEVGRWQKKLNHPCGVSSNCASVQRPNYAVCCTECDV